VTMVWSIAIVVVWSMASGTSGTTIRMHHTSVGERLVELGMSSSVVDALAKANLLSDRALRLAQPPDLIAAGVPIGDALVIAHELGSASGMATQAPTTVATAAPTPKRPTGRPVLVTDHGATGDGHTDDLAAILRAVDDAMSPGGNQVALLLETVHSDVRAHVMRPHLSKSSLRACHFSAATNVFSHVLARSVFYSFTTR
jgi:hypothetical protein